ncbi:MAG: hypothetical protein ACYDEJ_09675 [Desulfitobacteriaceae bacterium]
MTKIIAVNRKYLTVTFGILFVCLIGLGALTLWNQNQVSVSANNVVPEIKMLSLTVEPTSLTKDLTYGGVTLKGMQVITAKTFDLIVTVQNITDQKMVNIPVELQISLFGDDKQKISKMGNLPALEPGGIAKVAFRQVKALGDAQGMSPTAGQHLILLRIKANPAGGVNQTTEASFRFNIDTTIKEPVKK